MQLELLCYIKQTIDTLTDNYEIILLNDVYPDNFCTR